ncbi:hypothetical protein E2562_026045 [Oryza meyeriana var. granulata]|uniref:Uncharacterized protein n=1 Tax=Oryza meyeriana var. granulata TaxID=110450 RepID=A0A6G1EPI0_9ORYZ|nr:hypothetical protein E2562_026045 [Oryza meyeriana var. granulata]
MGPTMKRRARRRSRGRPIRAEAKGVYWRGVEVDWCWQRRSVKVLAQGRWPLRSSQARRGGHRGEGGEDGAPLPRRWRRRSKWA